MKKKKYCFNREEYKTPQCLKQCDNCKTVDAIRRTGEEARKSPEAARRYLIAAGIIQPND